MMSKILLLAGLICVVAQSQGAAIDCVDTAWASHKVLIQFPILFLDLILFFKNKRMSTD